MRGTSSQGGMVYSIRPRARQATSAPSIPSLHRSASVLARRLYEQLHEAETTSIPALSSSGSQVAATRITSGVP